MLFTTLNLNRTTPCECVRFRFFLCSEKYCERYFYALQSCDTLINAKALSVVRAFRYGACIIDLDLVVIESVISRRISRIYARLKKCLNKFRRRPLQRRKMPHRSPQLSQMFLPHRVIRFARQSLLNTLISVRKFMSCVCDNARGRTKPNAIGL